MSINPDLPSDEPSDEASNHADAIRDLWNEARDLLRPLRDVFEQLKKYGAVDPCDWIDVIGKLMRADFTGCWDDDAAAWDKQATDNARQAADELREDRG